MLTNYTTEAEVNVNSPMDDDGLWKVKDTADLIQVWH